MASNFATRPLTVQESIWLQQGKRYKDLDSMAQFVEARLERPMDIRGLTMPEFNQLVDECIQACKEGEAIDDAVKDLIDNL